MDGGKKPVEVSLVYSLREESDDPEEVTDVGAEFVRRQGSKGQFNHCH